MDPLARYTLELSRPEGGWTRLEQTAARARQAAEEMRDEGIPVRFLRSVYVPEDQACFLLYEAPSEAAAREAASRVALDVRRARQVLRLDPRQKTEQ